MPVIECTHCSYKTKPTSGSKAYRFHVDREHCKVFIIKRKGKVWSCFYLTAEPDDLYVYLTAEAPNFTGCPTILATVVRASPTAFVSCPVVGCSHKPSKKSRNIEAHFRKMHCPAGMDISCSYVQFPDDLTLALPACRSISPTNSPLRLRCPSPPSIRPPSPNRYTEPDTPGLMDVDLPVGEKRDCAAVAIFPNLTDSMEVDDGSVARSQPTAPRMNVDHPNGADVEPTGSLGLPGMDDADIPMEVDAQTPHVAAEQLDLPADGSPTLIATGDSRGVGNENDTAAALDDSDCQLKIGELGNSGTKILVCMSCSSAVNPATIKAHFSEKKHWEKHGKWAALSLQAKEWIGRLEQDKTFAFNAQSVPAQTLGICWPPVEGLHIHQNGYQCRVCAKCYASEAACVDCSRAHGEHQSGSLINRQVSIQQVFHKYIAVDTDLSDASAATQLYIMLGYSSKVEALSSSAPPINTYETPPWVQETGWLDILRPFLKNGPTKLLRLISPPFNDKASTFASPLRYIIIKYMSAVRQLTLRHHPAIFEMRQYLQAGSIDAHTPAWKVLQPTSVQPYALLLHKLVFTVLVSRQNQDADAATGNYINLSPGLQEAADALFTQLEKFSEVGRHSQSSQPATTTDLDKDQDPEEEDNIVDGELSEMPECSSDEEDSYFQDAVHTLQGSADIKALHAVVRCVLLKEEQDTINGSLRENAFVERWLAIYNLLPSGSFRQTSSCTQGLSIITYHIRSAILVEALISPRPSGESHLRIIKKLAIDNIEKDSGSPFQTCQNYQNIATAITRNPKGPPPFLVSEDCSKISYKGKTFDVPAFGAAVRSLLASTQKDIDDLLSGVEKGCRPCLVDFPDIWSNEDNGYSWATAFLEATPNGTPNGTPATTRPGRPQDALIAALRRTLQFSSTNLVDGMRASEYLGQCTRICKNLALLVFLTMGKPPPVCNMVNFLYANSSTKKRNMFAQDGHFWFISRQSANLGVVGQSEGLTANKISASVTGLLVAYFLVVRPAEIWLYSQVHRSAQEIKEAGHLCSTMAWIDSCKMQKLKSQDLSQLVTDFFLQENLHRQTIGPSVYTQLHTEVALNYFERQAARIDVNAEQAGHSLGVARVSYANEKNQLPWMTSDKLLEFGRESEMWWGKLLQLDQDGRQPLIPLHLAPWKKAEDRITMNRMLDKINNILRTTSLPPISAKT